MHGKVRSKWDGPFKVVNKSSHGAITLQRNKGFKVNGQCLKVYLEPNKHENEEVDVIKFVQLC